MELCFPEPIWDLWAPPCALFGQPYCSSQSTGKGRDPSSELWGQGKGSREGFPRIKKAKQILHIKTMSPE